VLCYLAYYFVFLIFLLFVILFIPLMLRNWPFQLLVSTIKADYSPLTTALNMWILPPPSPCAILALCLDARRHLYLHANGSYFVAAHAV
jgi:hypothetical protein